MKVEQEISGVLEPLRSVLTKETHVNKSRFNPQTLRKL